MWLNKSGGQDSLLGETPKWSTDASLVGQSCTQGAKEVGKNGGVATKLDLGN